MSTGPSIFSGPRSARSWAPRSAPTRRRAFLRRVVRSDHALAAIGSGGQLLGVAGYKTQGGAFVGGDLADLAHVYGPFGGLWRGLLLSLIERDCEDGVLLMDGIFVAPEARGRGVGSALLGAVVGEAAARGLSAVRLDVIDTNPRARAFYERLGFAPCGTTRLGLLRHVFRFAAATQMRLDVTARRRESSP